MNALWREVGEYLRDQPLRDEDPAPTPAAADVDWALLCFISTFKVQHGRVPRFSEIADTRGLTRTGAKQAVRRLRAQGQLDGYYPSLRLVPPLTPRSNG